MKQSNQPAPQTVSGYTKGEWKVSDGSTHNVWITSENKKSGFVVASLERALVIPEAIGEAEANAQRIVHCVNNFDSLTDKCNRQEVLIGEMKEALQRCVSYLADLNGSSWIEGEDIGIKEMRGRAKSLQQITYNILTKANNKQ